MTLGDVLAVVMGVLATGTCLWAAFLGAAFLFPRKSEAARDALTQQTKKTLGVGVVTALLAGFGGIALLNVPNGLLKLIGWVLLVGLLTCACLGSAGLSLLAADRIRERDKRTRPIAALRLGAAVLVCAGFLPVVGWLFLFPVSLIASVGAGLIALRSKASRSVALTTPPQTATAQALEASGFHG